VDPTKDHLFHPLQLWGIVRIAERIQAIRRSIAKLSNHSQIASTGETYFYEAFRDPIIAASILNIINEVYRGKDHLAQIKALRDAPVDSKMLNNTLVLPHSDPRFVLSRKFVEDSCRTAVVSTYGSFTAFTEPILSQTILTQMTNKMKVCCFSFIWFNTTTLSQLLFMTPNT
jgi:hypothetical protein